MVGDWLDRPVEQELLVARPKSRGPGEQEHTYRHALLREGTSATFTEEDRRLGHRLAGEWLEQHGEADPMVLAGHFERGGDGARAASFYLRAAEQAFHVLDLEAALSRVGLGLACAPPPELRISLLGLRCEASGFGLQLVGAVMADAEELLRSAPRGSVPWAQGLYPYIEGTMMAGRMEDLTAAIALLQEVDPAPEALGKLVFLQMVSAYILDVLGKMPEGTVLEQRASAVLRSTGDREPLAQFWLHIMIAMRASYAHEDPWTGLEHSGYNSRPTA
jgi:hypothetical protein